MGRLFAGILVGLHANWEVAKAKFRDEARADGSIASRGKCIPINGIVLRLVPIVAVAQVVDHGRGRRRPTQSGCMAASDGFVPDVQLAHRQTEDGDDGNRMLDRSEGHGDKSVSFAVELRRKGEEMNGLVFIMMSWSSS
jgi:hypothetical protein